MIPQNSGEFCYDLLLRTGRTMPLIRNQKLQRALGGTFIERLSVAAPSNFQMFLMRFQCMLVKANPADYEEARR